jgi:predicted DNA-binding transcriptional regulator AlpA
MDLLPTPSGGEADAANARSKVSHSAWIPAPELADELGVCTRTLDRWLRDVALAFPRPRCVNKRRYFERNAIEAWKTSQAVKVAGG